MDDLFSNRLRPRGRRSQTANPPPSNEETSLSATETPPTDPSTRPTRSGSTLDNFQRPSRRPHPYLRQTRSSIRHSSPPPPSEVVAPPTPPPEAPPTTSRRAARRNLDAASQQRLFLRRNLISSPRLTGAELTSTTPVPSSDSSTTSSSTQRRTRGNRGRGGARGGGQIDFIRDRLQPTEARSRSSSASSIIRARLTARISFGQRLALSPPSSSSAPVSPPPSPSNGNDANQTGSDRLTRNGARRAAEAIVDRRISGIPELVGIEGGSSGVLHEEASASHDDRGDRMGVLSGPGWSGTLDRTHGDEITVQIIDFGRIMGIPPYEIQLLNNLQGQFRDMLHRSFHHSITSRNFEEIPQRVVREEDSLNEGERKVESAKENNEYGGVERDNGGDDSDNADQVPSRVKREDPNDNSESSSASTTTATTESRNCTICLMAPVVNDVLKTLPCEHFFHSDCLKQWFTDHASCPMCRDCALCRISGAFNVQFSPS